MIKTKKPDFSVREVFLACISTVKNPTLKNELTECVDILEIAETEFEKKFQSLEIHLVSQSTIIKGKIDKEEMKKVYDYRMVNPDMPGNPYYNKIKSSAPFGKCPLCSVRGVDTLDHYLPKAKFPIYAVTPITLVPACTPCNKRKLISYPQNSEEQTLHPYYDDIEKASWLKADVIQTNPITIAYFVIDVAHWPPLLLARTKNHFKSFNLGELFSSHANEELRGSIGQLRKLYNRNPSLLKEHLYESWDSKLALGQNSWQATMYKALYDDDWFCTGGVLQEI